MSMSKTVSPETKLAVDVSDIEVEAQEPEHDKPAESKEKTLAKSAAKRRTKTGCLTCRKRRVKCDESKPFCGNCIKSKRPCAGYVQPLVYKQQQGLTAHGTGITTTLNQSDFHFDHGFGPAPHTAHPTMGSYNHFMPTDGDIANFDLHNQVNNAGLTSPYTGTGPGLYSGTSYGQHAPVFHSSDAGRRHSFHSRHTHPDVPVLHHHPMQATEQPLSWNNAGDSFYAIERGPYLSEDPPSGGYDSVTMLSGALGGRPVGYFQGDANPLSANPSRRYSAHGFFQSAPLHVPTLTVPHGVLEEMESPDDPFDVDIDDAETEDLDPRQPSVSNESSRRKQGMLRSLHPQSPASPLLDERNAKVFSHFVDVLGKCLSIFERSSLNPWASPPHTLWSYTLATAAMSSPALAHAILAVSGLHIAKLQQTTEHVSLKHFTYAARRVGKLLSVPERRHEPATLAAISLLGYYEILNADHSRWNLHLAGATKLVMEHDLTRLTCRARNTRRQVKQMMANGGPLSVSRDALGRHAMAPSFMNDIDWEVDQNLVSQLTGLPIDYDTPREPMTAAELNSQPMNEAEAAVYKTKVDLWWWFCKQDLFQSMVSGDRLLMPFWQRRFCPPRGPLGQAHVAYATFDHLVLLLSRLTDFGGKDRHRKQRVVQAQGGQWRPPPWLFANRPNPSGSSENAPATPHYSSAAQAGPDAVDPIIAVNSSEGHRAPSANEGRARHSKGGQHASMSSAEPPMYGMMQPPQIPPKMHPAFHAMSQSIRAGGPETASPSSTETSTKMTLEEETAAAVLEHTAIKEAFEQFHKCLGPGFLPITNEGGYEYSPFGPRLRYSSPELACILALYHVGRILLYRLHPDMPPAAMVAAGVTAHLTKDYAQTVGQICAGLFSSIPSGPPGQPLSPQLAGAMIEITFPLLFCGVQYSEISQRGWVVSKLHDIAVMTGWQTSAAVAAACEIAWEKMAQAGKGPPYIRSLDRNNKDNRINGNVRRTTPHTGTDLSEAESEHESQFVSHDRSLISKHGPSRVHWAMGLLSLEEDVKEMNIGVE